MESKTTLEFDVNLTCGKCEKAVSGALSAAGINDYSIDVAGKKVVVATERTSDEVRETIESVGKVAVLVGAGGVLGVLGAAVAMLGVDGDYFSPGPKGVIRLTQLMSGCVIEGTVDGLSPGHHGLAIHETGDTSQGDSSSINIMMMMMMTMMMMM